MAAITYRTGSELDFDSVVELYRTPTSGGKGGVQPDNARGGGKDATKLDATLAKAKELFA